VGKKENCVVSVHLGYATPEFYSLIDGEVYLPEETWYKDRPRCREAGIPEEVMYRPKWQMALDQYRRAVANGVRFAWLTFDEGYGGKGPFLRELDGLGQNYVAEVPASFPVWTKRPTVLYRATARDRQGRRPRLYPRLKVKNNPKVEVRNVLVYSPKMREITWQDYHVKDGSKGPMVWQAKRLLVYLADAQGLPTRPYHLLVARTMPWITMRSSTSSVMRRNGRRSRRCCGWLSRDGLLSEPLRTVRPNWGWITSRSASSFRSNDI